MISGVVNDLLSRCLVARAERPLAPAARLAADIVETLPWGSVLELSRQPGIPAQRDPAGLDRVVEWKARAFVVDFLGRVGDPGEAVRGVFLGVLRRHRRMRARYPDATAGELVDRVLADLPREHLVVLAAHQLGLEEAGFDGALSTDALARRFVADLAEGSGAGA